MSDRNSSLGCKFFLCQLVKLLNKDINRSQRVIMINQLITIVVLSMLLLFVVSPFSALAGLMLILFVAAAYTLAINLFQVLIGSSKADTKES